MLLHHFLLLFLLLLLTRPLKIAGEDQPGAGDPFVQSLVELVPVDEKLEFVEFRVWNKSVRTRCRSWAGYLGRAVARSGRLATKIWVVIFVANRENLSESFFLF